MIAYDKELKQIVIPNGLGNVNIVINGGGDCPEPNLGALVKEITENGNYVYNPNNDGLDGYNMANIRINVPQEGGEGSDCNLISPIVFSKDAGNTINAENVNIPTFVYEGNQYYNMDIFNLADIEEFKIQIRFQPTNGGYGEPINIFGCEDTDWDDTTFGARIYEGQIYFRMSGEDMAYPYNVSAWYDVEMGYNASKRWVIVNGQTLLETEHTVLNRPNQTLMIGAINRGGNAFRPFYGKIATIYIESNGNQVYLLPKEDGTMDVYWNNKNTRWISKSGDNNARFENEYMSGDGMKSITWLGNLEDKQVTPSMSERDDNGLIVVNPSEGYNGLSRTVIDPQNIYNEGLEAGRTEGEASLAAKARVLNVTENGVYKSKYSDPIIPANYTVTGVYADGTQFYSYAELTNRVFNTKIAGTVDSRLEFWYKGDNTLAGDAFNVIIGSGNYDDSDCFQVRYDTFSNNDLLIGVGNTTINVSGWDDTVWHHLIISKAEGLWIDGEKKGDFSPTNTINGEFFINGVCYDTGRNANGTFGMIKIDDVVFIPTADGFKNVNTGELLEVMRDGAYTFTENLPIYGEGELYKTINVNVNVPKINVPKAGIKFGYSKITEVPDWADFDGITDFSNMFNECGNLKRIPAIDTSQVTEMNSTFKSCSNLETIPLLDTSKVTTMDSTFRLCTKLSNFPSIDTSSVTKMVNAFSTCDSLTSLPALNMQSLNMYSFYGIFGSNELPNLINFGGFLNLKNSLTNDKNLKKLPNLTYESCINVLNGLYDFVGNGETPNSNQGQLKVHQNFLDTVGEEISIGTNKGWTITV